MNTEVIAYIAPSGHLVYFEAYVGAELGARFEEQVGGDKGDVFRRLLFGSYGRTAKYRHTVALLVSVPMALSTLTLHPPRHPRRTYDGCPSTGAVISVSIHCVV